VKVFQEEKSGIREEEKTIKFGRNLSVNERGVFDDFLVEF
jgi:hypothetical protein